MDDMETKLEKLEPGQRPDFCVTVNFRKSSARPERVFLAAASFIESLQGLDVILVQAVDSKIKPVLLLEEIESGSLKIWLKQFIEAVDDEALKKLDWKPAVGKYLVKGKYILLKFLEGKKRLESRESLESLALDLHKLAQETEAKKLPAYRPVSPSDLAQGMRRVSEAIGSLEEGDTVAFSADEGDAAITPGLMISQEAITELLSGETIANEVEKILMVRRPDFLGDAMWEFRHEKKSFSAKIEDESWLAAFRAGEQIIRPGDALRVKVLETTTYGNDGEVLSESRVIVHVLSILRVNIFPLPL